MNRDSLATLPLTFGDKAPVSDGGAESQEHRPRIDPEPENRDAQDGEDHLLPRREIGNLPLLPVWPVNRILHEA